jgi:hypothetical protein
MLRVSEGFPAELALVGRDECPVQALEELGHRARLVTDPEAGAAFELCRSEIIAGRAPLAHGWDSNPAEWSVVVGTQGTDLLGYCFGSAGRRERHPAAMSSLLILGDAIERRPAPDAVRAALTRAIPLLQGNLGQYEAWLALLGAPEPYGPALLRVQTFMGEQWLSACLADARDAGATYLASLAEDAPEQLGEALEPAADRASRLAELAERLLVPPDAIHRAHLPEDLDWRQRRCNTLRAMRDLEADLQGILGRLLRDAGNPRGPDE